MADGNAQSRYVKLTKDQVPTEDITPGELNQPIPVPELIIHRCAECGQALPESYEPPADEDWTTGICGCADDSESCWTGLFCPCGLALAAATLFFHGIDPKTSFLICEGLLFTWWMCGIYTGLFRQSLQKHIILRIPCDPCMVHCCMHWCALCQEHREMKNHLSENAAMQMTVVNPPPAQQMNSGGSQESASDDQSTRNGAHTNLEIQPL
ncbi:hypothetical protein GH714_019044 [Hevea brasiliensis]|uniref:Cell number regulator 6 n=1 Tax=Hevea brasiliensis TaxID=3981 RepID=A0A6A6LSS3_HEVBR|nr:hypothetical protein GH714_019044 [Hevea brasiliensis]